MTEPRNTKKRKVLPGDKEKSLDMHQRKQGELPPQVDKTKDQNYCGTTMEEGTQDMDLDDVDNENKEMYNGYKVGKDKEDTYKNVDFFSPKLGEDHRLIVDAAKKPGAGE